MLTIVVSALNLSKIIATLDGVYGGTPINGLGVRGRGLFSDVDYVDQLICALRLFLPPRGRGVREEGELLPFQHRTPRPRVLLGAD